MKAFGTFFLFLVHRYHCWARTPNRIGDRFVAHGLMGLNIVVNLVTVLNLVGLLRGKRLLWAELPRFERGWALFLVCVLFCALASFVLGAFRLVERSETKEMLARYAAYGFKKWHALAYAIGSVVLLMFIGFLRGRGVF